MPAIFRSLTCALLLSAASFAAANPPDLDADIRAGIGRVTAELRAPQIPAGELDLATFAGHAPDGAGSHDFAPDLRRALAELASRGGGTLTLRHPAGRFEWVKPVVTFRLSGPIELPSRTRLLLDPSTRLRFECRPANYAGPAGDGVLTRYEGTTIYGSAPLIRAFGAHDIELAAAPGHGAMPEITGDGGAWVAWQHQTAPGASSEIRAANQAAAPLAGRRSPQPGVFLRRPVMLQFFLCRDVAVSGLKLSDAPFWMVHPVFSERLAFRDLLFDGPNVNNDGIDVDSSRAVLIERVMFNNHDDNVALKSGRDREGREGLAIASTVLEPLAAPLGSPYLRDGRLGGPTEDVVIRDCVFKGHYALAIGSEMSGGVRRIYALDNHAVHSVANVLFMKSSRARGGVVEDIHVRGFDAQVTRGDAIAFIPNYDGDTASAHPPAFRRIYVSRVTVARAGRGLTLRGWPDAPITDVRFEDVQIRTTQSDSPARPTFDLGGVERVEFLRATLNGTALDGTYTRPAEAPPPKRN